jgi:hypothetical protein
MNAVYARKVRTATNYGSDFRADFLLRFIGILWEDLLTTWKRLRAAFEEARS